MTTRKNNKPRKSKTNNKTRKNNQSKKNMIMKGGAHQIGGFVSIMKFLYTFNSSRNASESLPNVLEFVDYHGKNISIVCRWERRGFYNQTSNSNSNDIFYKHQFDKVKTYYDFRDFREEVITSLKNIEKSIYDANINIKSGNNEFIGFISMLAKRNGAYPYYLLTKKNMNDTMIVE